MRIVRTSSPWCAKAWRILLVLAVVRVRAGLARMLLGVAAALFLVSAIGLPAALGGAPGWIVNVGLAVSLGTAAAGLAVLAHR